MRTRTYNEAKSGPDRARVSLRSVAAKPKDYRYFMTKPIDPAKPLDKFRFKIVSDWGKQTLLQSIARLEKENGIQ